MSAPKVQPITVNCGVCRKPFLVGGRGRPKKTARYCSLRCLALSRVRQATIGQLTDLEAAYCAGLFDGEGSVVMWDRGHGGRPQLRCTVANTYRPVVEWLRATLGTGSIVTKKYTRLGQEHYLDAYTFQVYGQNAVEWLRQMLPFLIIKREKALEGIASQPTTM